MLKYLSLASGVVVAWGLLVGCGGESTDASRFSSGTPEKPLSSVTDAEMESLCEGVTEYFSEKEFITGACRFGAIFTAAFQFEKATGIETLRTRCTDFENQCLNAVEKGMALPPRACTKPAGACTATFADVEACASDVRQSEWDFHGKLPVCGSLKLSDFESGGALPDLSEEPYGLPLPESCRLLEEKCPGARSGAGIRMLIESTDDPPVGD